MAHLNLRSYNNSTLISVDSVSVLSSFTGNVSTGGGGGGDAENVSQIPKSSQIASEIDKQLSELRCKRTFQDEDSSNGLTASIFSTLEMSQLIALICGVKKSELRPDLRNNIQHMTEFFKELIVNTNIPNGIKVKEGINELFHNPEHLVFQNPLTNEPLEWAKLVLPILLDIQRKEVLKEEIRKDIEDFQLKRRELAKDIGLQDKKLKELQAMRNEKEDKMQVDSIRRLNIALESNKAEADQIESELSKYGPVIPSSEVEDVVSQYSSLKARRESLEKELQSISADGMLPPGISEASLVLEDRKRYLEKLLFQISNPADVSSRSSFGSQQRKSSN